MWTCWGAKPLIYPELSETFGLHLPSFGKCTTILPNVYLNATHCFARDGAGARARVPWLRYCYLSRCTENADLDRRVPVRLRRLLPDRPMPSQCLLDGQPRRSHRHGLEPSAGLRWPASGGCFAL